MSESIYDTVVAYIGNCKSQKLAANPFVLDALQKLKDEAAFDEEATRFDLKLCANNKLTNPRNLRLTDPDCAVLCKTLQTNAVFVCLDLRYNNIGDAGAEAVAAMLTTNKSLTMLNLMCNCIEEAGAKAIANSLKSNNCLLDLSLAGNKIGDSGGMHFAEALQINVTLEWLDLGDCDLKINAVIALSTVLKSNDSLRGLNANRPLLWTQQEETTVRRQLPHRGNLAVLSGHSFEMKISI